VLARGVLRCIRRRLALFTRTSRRTGSAAIGLAAIRACIGWRSRGARGTPSAAAHQQNESSCD